MICLTASQLIFIAACAAVSHADLDARDLHELPPSFYDADDIQKLQLERLITNREEKKRMSEFVGKRTLKDFGNQNDKRMSEFVGKRMSEFVGKRMSEFVGKRMSEFVGKRKSDLPDQHDEYEKRMSEFVGK